MASVINQIKVGDVKYALAHSVVAVCEDAATTVDKTATILTDGDEDNNAFTLVIGVVVTVLFNSVNNASNATLNINNTGAYPLRLIGTTPVPPNYLKSGIPHLLLFTGEAWQPLASRPSIEFNLWEAND